MSNLLCNRLACPMRNREVLGSSPSCVSFVSEISMVRFSTKVPLFAVQYHLVRRDKQFDLISLSLYQRSSQYDYTGYTPSQMAIFLLHGKLEIRQTRTQNVGPNQFELAVLYCT